ncbi:MAG: methyltransferase, partial [Steroidobacteraceae bacterium]
LQHSLLRGLNRKRLERPVLERIAGETLVVMPGVLHPRLMRTGAFFARALQSDPLLNGADVLDLGTGSGICAVVAARRASSVAAVDLSRAAVHCAYINVVLSDLEDKVEVLLGDLYGPISGRRFDLILFNPPFVRGRPRDEADLAWRSLDVAERFAAGLDDHLSPSGSALLLLSTFGDAAGYLRPLSDTGFVITLRARREFLNERLSLFRVRRRSDQPDERAIGDMQ